MRRNNKDLLKIKNKIEVELKYLHPQLRNSRTPKVEDLCKREMDFLQELRFDLDQILHKNEKNF